jgi:hypothetical protein
VVTIKVGEWERPNSVKYIDTRVDLVYDRVSMNMYLGIHLGM